MSTKTVLVIDDDVNICRIVEHTFHQAGNQVITALNGPEGLHQLYEHHPDLVILDVMMPEMSGWEVCRRIRQLTDVPVIMLTALKNDEEIIQGLDVGADDFISKPFNPPVLLARARAVLRRAEQLPRKVTTRGFQDDYLQIDLEKYRVHIQGVAVKLTPLEYRLLAYLVEHIGHVRTFEQILENVWGWEYRDSPDYVHVYISHLRQKIEPDPKKPRYILTDHGLGYHFEKQAYPNR